MINNLKLINFRNFDELKIENILNENFIIWENWKWKTNILESISLLSNNSIIWLNLDEYIKNWKNFFFIEYETNYWDKISFWYSKEKKKKQFLLNNKKISKKKFNEKTNKCIIFSPIIMNIMYLWPSLRRNFLDNLLNNSYEEYEKIYLNYKKIIKHRNKTLKSINEWKCNINELNFWNEKFINEASKIYYYRFKIINFFKNSILNTKDFFSWKIEKIEFIYISKVDEKNIKESLSKYLQKNLNRDIILWKTPIWPHIDDFDILIDWKKISHFASRWETKSIIIWLKLIEWIFIEKITGKKPIFLIDDLLSELDFNHKNLLLEKIKYYQSFITSIEKSKWEKLFII